jgi:hypothetical protein
MTGAWLRRAKRAAAKRPTLPPGERQNRPHSALLHRSTIGVRAYRVDARYTTFYDDDKDS